MKPLDRGPEPGCLYRNALPGGATAFRRGILTPNRGIATCERRHGRSPRAQEWLIVKSLPHASRIGRLPKLAHRG